MSLCWDILSPNIYIPEHDYSVYRVTLSGNTQVQIYTHNDCIIRTSIQDLDEDTDYRIPCYVYTVTSHGSTLVNYKADVYLKCRRVPRIDEYYTSTLYNGINRVDSYHSSRYTVLNPNIDDGLLSYEKKIHSSVELDILSLKDRDTRILTLDVTKEECQYDFYDVEVPYLQQQLIINGRELQKSLVFCLGKCTLVPMLYESIVQPSTPEIEWTDFTLANISVFNTSTIEDIH